MREVGARDRLVMAGLVILGLLTVIAGVLSGRSTINYVLAKGRAKPPSAGPARSTEVCT